MEDRELHDGTLLQCGRIGLHLCLINYQVLTVEIGPHIHTVCDDNYGGLPSDIHDIPGSRMMDRSVVLESLQQFLEWEYNRPHMGHCGCELS